MDYYQGNKPCGDFSPTSILLSRIQVFWSPCFMQPITCILSDVLCRTKIFWAFLVYFLLCIPCPFSLNIWLHHLIPSHFFVMILSEQQLTQSSLQSLLLYWLGVKLNIFLCTLLLNKDLHRSAFCAFVSLHTPCLFVCSNRRFLA